MISFSEDITPSKAAQYLKDNACGRNLVQEKVDMYARDMIAGKWRLTHQGIGFDEDGILIDGQHRLTAICRAGVTIRMGVTEGISREAFGVIDTGRVRSMANRFTIEGHGKHATQLAAVSRRTAVWLDGRIWARKYHPTHDEIAQVVENHPDLVEAAQFAHAWPARRTLAPAMAGFCWWLFSQIDRDDAEHFMASLRTGENLERGDPVLALRERLIKDRTAGHHANYAVGHQRQEVILALTIMAWNHYRLRNRITKLQLPSSINDETFPRPV